MGIYLFRTEALREHLMQDAEDETSPMILDEALFRA